MGGGRYERGEGGMEVFKRKVNKVSEGSVKDKCKKEGESGKRKTQN